MNDRPRKLAIVGLLVATFLLVRPTLAYAYCDTGYESYQSSFGGGYQNYGPACCLQAVSGWITAGKYDPPSYGHSAWVMLTSYTSDGFAQAGWKYNMFETSYYKFAGWRPAGGLYDEFLWRSGGQPQFSHTYEVDAISADSHFDFWSDGGVFWNTPPNQGWTPNQVQDFSESHDHNAHFPGSIGYEIEHWGLSAKNNYQWESSNLSPSPTQPFPDVVGYRYAAGNDFYSWDKRCTDAPTG